MLDANYKTNRRAANFSGLLFKPHCVRVQTALVALPQVFGAPGAAERPNDLHID